MKLAKHSLGVGDRFGHQAGAQLRALIRAREQGVEVAPVWNKSHREHGLLGTSPADVRQAAEAAVQTLGWQGAYHVDADHIGLANADLFLESCDFFTLDVADFTGTSAGDDEVRAFVDRNRRYIGEWPLIGGGEDAALSEGLLDAIARKYLLAAQEAGRIYRHLAAARGAGTFVTEVSVDETDQPQTPVELFFILAALAQEGIPVQTIAPKFTGRFNKGVDYAGDVKQFAIEFDQHLAVIAGAVRELGLPENLKLSVHSGSDKFSLYPIMKEAIRKHDAGLHLKTAGTTWLEELIGLSVAGGEGLQIAKEIYRTAHSRREELCHPYAAVIDLDPAQLPSPAEVHGWTGEQYARALRHDQSCPAYNATFRQLLHVSFKVAAELGERYRLALVAFEEAIAENVTANLYDRHVTPLFLA